MEFQNTDSVVPVDRLQNRSFRLTSKRDGGYFIGTSNRVTPKS